MKTPIDVLVVPEKGSSRLQMTPPSEEELAKLLGVAKFDDKHVLFVVLTGDLDQPARLCTALRAPREAGFNRRASKLASVHSNEKRPYKLYGPSILLGPGPQLASAPNDLASRVLKADEAIVRLFGDKMLDKISSMDEAAFMELNPNAVSGLAGLPPELAALVKGLTEGLSSAGFKPDVEVSSGHGLQSLIDAITGGVSKDTKVGIHVLGPFTADSDDPTAEMAKMLGKLLEPKKDKDEKKKDGGGGRKWHKRI